MYVGYNPRNTRQGGRTSAAATEKGPNDAERVVWALGEFLFF